MSASLVGSEMCIRDSPTSSMGAWVSAVVVGSLARWVMGHGDDAEIAVSYTHLTLPTICSV
eukprot:1747298-Alexandrium_andersonii.AAC.1